jgi:hypothetical protein
MAMVRIKVGRIVGTVLCGAVLLGIPQAVFAQSSTFIVPFQRAGAPIYDPLTGAQVDGAFVNPCTAEFVDVFGSSTISIATSVMNGVVKTTVGVVSKGNGTGWTLGADGVTVIVSGKTYVFTDSQQFTVKASLGDVVESDFFDKFNLKGTRSTDNWIIRARFRVKIGSNGQVQVNLVKLSDGDTCKG